MTQETNYCAEAVDGLVNTAEMCINRNDKEFILSCIPKMKSAIKFRLPDYGCLFEIDKKQGIEDSLKKYCSTLRLPYKTILLEYAIGNDPLRFTDYDHKVQTINHDAVICMASEIDVDGDSHIVINPFYRSKAYGPRLWLPLNFGASINQNDYSIKFFAQSEEGKQLGRDNFSLVYSDIIGELTAFSQFITALSCSNSSIADDRPPSRELNAKRKRKGKTPFFTYKVLTISTGASSGKGESMGGSHSSPRVHLRRGHIRRLTDRTVWVNSCVVGDKSKGMVVKDYQVTA